ncbi:MAG: VanW family protein [Lysobacteraceae bacterium]
MSIDDRPLDTLQDAGLRERLLFRFKATALQAKRGIQDALSSEIRRHRASAALIDAPLLAESITPLWTMLDGESPRLTAGKVHNLRRAVRALDGIDIPANGVFSFWRQLGRATRSHGYVEGRELRSGCLVPTTGGGLCQLSCALYEVAAQSGMQIIERYAHSQRLPGVDGFPQFDATVFWNYVDLRWRSPFATRLQASLDADHLIVRLHAHPPDRRKRIHSAVVDSVAEAEHAGTEHAIAVPVRDCESCDETDCSRHQPRLPTARQTCVLIDERWPEFIAWLNQQPAGTSRAFVSWQPMRESPADIRSVAQLAALQSSIDMRIAQWRAQPAARGRMRRDRRVAAAMARMIDVDDRELVIAQTLLPWLWNLGVLGGRRFDVLMTRAPMAQIHHLLEQARQHWPESRTLGDFRAPTDLIDAETDALAHATRRIGSHPMWLCENDLHLPWQLPNATLSSAQRAPNQAARLLFPMTTLARNGACLLRDALRGTQRSLDLGGPVLESADFWRGIDVQPLARSNWNEATLALIPALLPSRPQAALALIAAGIPILATPEAGLDGLPGVRVASGDDPAQWRAAIAQMLGEPA